MPELKTASTRNLSVTYNDADRSVTISGYCMSFVVQRSELKTLVTILKCMTDTDD